MFRSTLAACTMGASLYEPINVYKPLAPDIGIVDGPFEYLIVGGIRLPLPFTTRMTVMRLSSGDLVLYSLIRFDEGLARELLRLGTVGSIRFAADSRVGAFAGARPRGLPLHMTGFRRVRSFAAPAGRCDPTLGSGSHH
jgi:hypothetical protein